MTQFVIRPILHRSAPTFAADLSIRRAVAGLVQSGASAAAVLDDTGSLIGLLTQRDCFEPTLHAAYYQEWKGQVADHMSRDVVSVAPDEDVIRVAEMFVEHPYRVFPALDGRAYAGLVHRADVLALLSRMG